MKPAGWDQTELIRKKHGSAVYRVRRGSRSAILKCFTDESWAVEIKAYRLLVALGVPVLPVIEMTDDSLLLEDLATSRDWRLATAQDVDAEATGAAVAAWYLSLHEAGRRVEQKPGFLQREYDSLNTDVIAATGAKLGLSGNPVWSLTAAHIEPMKAAFRQFEETLNYNDFHWTNLALSRSEPLRAIVFDYHLLGIGPAYCDIRNVLGSLGDRAREAFVAAYGPVDERPRVLDAPLSVLYSLSVAAAMDSLPEWAEGCVRCVTSGELERMILTAVSDV